MTRLAIAALLLAAWPLAAGAQVLFGCKCDDVREMHDRWCSARAARSEYERIKSALEAESAKTGNARMLSPADKLMINQVCAQEAIDGASDKGVIKAAGSTVENNPLTAMYKDDCRVEVDESKGTACQREIVRAHEANHSNECKGRLSMWQDFPRESKLAAQALLYGASNTVSANLTGDTKFMLTSAQFASEEAASYAIEMQLISARWKDLHELCYEKAFEIEMTEKDEAYLGKDFSDNTPIDSNNGKKYAKLYDLSQSRCPRHPKPSPSQCTIK